MVGIHAGPLTLDGFSSFPLTLHGLLSGPLTLHRDRDWSELITNLSSERSRWHCHSGGKPGEPRTLDGILSCALALDGAFFPVICILTLI
jgi:hypothetical protein